MKGTLINENTAIVIWVTYSQGRITWFWEAQFAFPFSLYMLIPPQKSICHPLMIPAAS